MGYNSILSDNNSSLEPNVEGRKVARRIKSNRLHLCDTYTSGPAALGAQGADAIPKARPGGRRAGKRARRAWGTPRAGAAERRGRGSRGSAWPGPRAGRAGTAPAPPPVGAGLGGQLPPPGAGLPRVRRARRLRRCLGAARRAGVLTPVPSPTSGRACPGSIRRVRTDEPGHQSHELRAPGGGRVSLPSTAVSDLGPRRLGRHLTFLTRPRGPWSAFARLRCPAQVRPSGGPAPTSSWAGPHPPRRHRTPWVLGPAEYRGWVLRPLQNSRNSPSSVHSTSPSPGLCLGPRVGGRPESHWLTACVQQPLESRRGLGSECLPARWHMQGVRPGCRGWGTRARRPRSCRVPKQAPQHSGRVGPTL
ncbi:transcription initiation factor TFIID subunit 4-like [Manis pentadactyla]|uniref:transcription initiation factor TFIID subunit 4-like n=1 Tax=Manis pentadactyla TaxID=143292 RepID=UPI00255C90F6|nr:transcription initiation factor TFIID subunit 4-like [Manis pentadactyla]